MRLKLHIISVASIATLRQIADDFELTIEDRRQRDGLEDAISAARRCTPEELLRYLGEAEVKMVCEAANVSSKGRRGELVSRLLAVASPVRANKPEPLGHSAPTTSTKQPNLKRPMSDTTPTQTSLQLATTDSSLTNVEKYQFEPIKGYPLLNWRGKRPFTSTQYYPAQLKEVHGEEVDGWRNKIFWGDNLQVMSHLLKEFRGGIDLIYIDPPFDSDAEYKKKVKLKGKDVSGDTSSFEEKQYTDIWSNDEYLQFMFERIVMLRELLSRDGTCVVHVDSSKVHHLRCILDEIFGEKNFKNEIIWYYENKLGTGGNTIDSRHDTLLVYCKGGAQTYNPILLPVKNIKPQPVTQKIDGKRVWLKDENGKNLYPASRFRLLHRCFALQHPIR